MTKLTDSRNRWMIRRKEEGEDDEQKDRQVYNIDPRRLLLPFRPENILLPLGLGLVGIMDQFSSTFSGCGSVSSSQ